MFRSGQSKGRREASFHPSVPSSIHASICPVIHPSRHGLFTPMGWRKSEIQTWCGGQMYRQIHTHTCALGTRYIHLSRHPSIHLSGHPFVPSWFVYSDGAEKEWNQHPLAHQVVVLSMGWVAFLHPASIIQLFLVSDQ